MEQERGCSRVLSQGPPGWWLCLPLPPPRGFLQEAVSLAEVSLIVQPVQEGFLEETQANW